MWWGGSEEEQVGDSPPADTTQPEAASSDDPKVVKQELGDLKEQFNEQQALIGQLKSMLKDKDSSFTTREKEVEDLGARLARMKPRLGRVDAKKKTTQTTEKREKQEGAPAAGGGGAVAPAEKEESPIKKSEEKPVEKRLPSSESGSRAKILLLRKQLEENRLKFERQQKDNVEKRAAMEEMKQRIDKLRSEVEQRDTMIQTLQEGTSSLSDETMTQKLLQQILYKDNTLLELSQKVERLEEVIQSHKEALDEKDKVIESRTEAVTLIAKSENDKNLKTLQELEEVRYQMKKMQEDFISKEEAFETEKESMGREIKEKTKKVKQLEENGRRLENLRFELSTRNAELQEKIVTMQGDIKELRSQTESDRNSYEGKDTLIQDLRQKLVKAEAHGQKKLRALEKQLKSLKGNGNAGEQILELQNSIAELEEEKGNLQLKLVDFDDLKVANEKLTLQRKKLEEQIKQQNNDLDSQLSAITLLETEKIKLVEGINERENRIYDLESDLTSRKQDLMESNQTKVTLELKLCEVEEQRDMAEKARTELQNQMSESNMKSNEELKAEKAALEESVQSYIKERDDLQEKVTSQIASVEECKERARVAEQEMEEKSKECKRLMNILTDKENAIITMSITIDKHDVVTAEIEGKLSASVKEVEEKEAELKELNDVLVKERDTIEQLKSQLETKSSELTSKEGELLRVSESVESLNRAVNERNISVQNLVGEVTSLQDEIKRKDKSINDYINRLEELETHLRHQDSKIDELDSICVQKEQQLSDESSENTKLRNDIANLTQKYENTKSSLETELDVTITMMNDCKNQIEAAKAEIKVKEKEIQNNQIVIAKYEEEICSKNLTIDEIEAKNRKLQQRISEMSKDLSGKAEEISRIHSEVEERVVQIEKLNEVNVSMERRVMALEEEKSQISQISQNLQEELNETKTVIHQKEETLHHLNTEITNKSHELMQEVDYLKQTIAEKTHEISALESTLGSLRSELEGRTSEAEKWQTEALEKSNSLAEVTEGLDAARIDIENKDKALGELNALLTHNQECLTASEEQRNQSQAQITELQESYRLKEGELMELQNRLSETEGRLGEAMRYYEESQEQLRASQSELQVSQTQCHDNSSVITKLEQELLSKSADMKTSEEHLTYELGNARKELESVNAELETQKSKVTDLEMEVQSGKEYAENLEVGSMKVQEWATELQSELERMKAEHASLQNELTAMKEELTSRNGHLEKVQLELEQERQSSQSLRAELSHAISLSTQNESEGKAVSLSQQQRISQLENELLVSSQAHDQLKVLMEEKSQLLQTQADLTMELNASVDSLKLTVTAKEEEVQALQNTLLEKQRAEAEIQSSLKEAVEAKEVLESNVAWQSRPFSEMDDQGLKDELKAAQDQSKLIEAERMSLNAEVDTLKQQLHEARQTITQLQTSLASTAQPSQPDWDDWGEVDLGTPESQGVVPVPESTDVTNLKKSLADKDELLRMIQEQLKEALQQVNTSTEEKKVLEQQRRSDETLITQQQQQLERDQSEISSMKSELESLSGVRKTYKGVNERITELEEQLAGKQREIEVLQHELINRESHTTTQDQHHLTYEEVPAIPPTGEVVTGTPLTETEVGGGEVKQEAPQAAHFETQEAAIHWQQQTEESTVKESETDPASWFDQDAFPVAAEPEPIPAQETEPTPLQESTQTQSQAGVDVEELQYKLSWYEEQWTTWTGHYTQLQTTHNEALEQIAQLTQQLQDLQVSTSQTPTVSNQDEDASKHQLEQVQSKLSEVEATSERLREENTKLHENLETLKAQVDSGSDVGSLMYQLSESQAEVDRLRGFETQVYELQSQVQALQHQCDAMQHKLGEAENERTRLHEIEVLYGELQSCIQESETKREGSMSRVQELELMVQSAESEIARLRNEIEVLSQASEEVQSDRERLQTDAQGLGAEMSKLDCEMQHLQSEVKKYKKEIGRLQSDIEISKSEGVRLHSENETCKSDVARLQRENEDLQGEVMRTRSEYQRLEQESNQLRSELEVMEGEHGRLQCDYSILEGENNRVRGEYEALSQANQMTEAEKESLESEVQRITAQNTTISSENTHLKDEIQRLTEVSTSAETEINRQRTEIEKFRSLDSQYRELQGKYGELQTQVASMETSTRNVPASESYNLLAEEVDWSAEGQIEDEHLLQSSADSKYKEEIENLKGKLIALEKEKNSLYDELTAAKMKSGKMLQKFKLAQSKNEVLNKEVQKLKAKAGGFSDLDQALEEEWKAQVSRAETERDELKQRIDEMESEKENLTSQIDVLTAAQEKYLELKEDQDQALQSLRTENSELKAEVNALEWRVSELEESLEESQREASRTITTPVEGRQSNQTDADVGALAGQVGYLQQQIDELRSENRRLEEFNKDLGERVLQQSSENENLQSILQSLKDAKTKAEGDVQTYKSSYIELDTEHNELKKEKDEINERLRELTYTHDTLEAAYNSMFSEYNDLRDVCDSHKHDVGILKGERDRLVEEVDSLKKQLGALHEEEEEEIIRALQDECFSLREQNNLLHEESTALEVQAQEAREKVTRITNALEQNIEVQKLLRDELTKKNEDISFHTTTIEGQERQIAYLKAEIAAMKTKLTQQDQAEENTEETTQRLQQQVEQLQEVNQQLQLQVKAAETSLTKLARSGEEEGGAAPSSMISSEELEAALASLHLRELRCQQLSLEITKLLEERDALQLKLSASLRQTQELTRELSLSHQLPPPASPVPSLHEKLAELRELNDSLEQKALSTLQVAASGQRVSVPGMSPSPMFVSHTAPPTPTATRHADYTLTRETQGTSSTLYEWLMGKSTPKVMHV